MKKNIICLLILGFIVIIGCSKEEKAVTPVSTTTTPTATSSTTLSDIQGLWYLTYYTTGKNAYFYTGTASKVDFTMNPYQSIPNWYESLGVIGATAYPTVSGYSYTASSNSINNYVINSMTSTEFEAQQSTNIYNYKKVDWTPTTIRWNVDFDVYPATTPTGTATITIKNPPLADVIVNLVTGQTSYTGTINYTPGIAAVDFEVNIQGQLNNNVNLSTSIELDNIIVANHSQLFGAGGFIMFSGGHSDLSFVNM